MKIKKWIVGTSNFDSIDATMPYSLEWLVEAHQRFGTECPLGGDEMTHALAGAR